MRDRLGPLPDGFVRTTAQLTDPEQMLRAISSRQRDRTAPPLESAGEDKARIVEDLAAKEQHPRTGG
jgi:hypothetical protein